MKISEIANVTGLNISNIRFYEKKGLITPNRKSDSKYRDYTQEDLEQIKEIIMYRKMELPIEAIRDIFNGKSDIKQILSEHIEVLKNQMENKREAIALCEALLEGNNVDFFENLNTDFKLKNKEKSIFSFADDIYENYSEFSVDLLFGQENWLSAFIPLRWKRRISVMIWSFVSVVLPVVQMYKIYCNHGFTYSIWLYLCLFCVYNYAFINYYITKKADAKHSCNL